MSASPAAGLSALVARVDRDALAEALLQRFRDHIAGYARLPDAVLHGQISAVLRRNLELCLHWVATGEEPTTDDLAPFRASAKERAIEGMPLEDLLHAYRLGGKAGWHALVAAAEDDDRDALPHAAELVMDYVDRVSATVAQAYLEERQHLVSEEERGVRRLLDALTADAPVAPGLHETAARLRFPIAERYRVFAIALPHGSARRHAHHAAALRDQGVLALTEGDRLVAIAPAGAGAPVGLPPQSLVVGTRDVPRAQLAGALDDVRLAADLGRRLGRAGEVAVDELLLELLLARSPDLAATLEQRVLGPLEALGPRASRSLLETLAAFLAARLDRRAAAARLHVHPNTVDYRVARIQEVTGLHLADPGDLATVVLALRAQETRTGSGTDR